ncbi:hypothetical protein KY308_04420, partial [Candidatus Woesearchaeota archaeon]|nr:hypothetical protein [Candidatus Woesearchaeota archaeon]
SIVFHEGEESMKKVSAFKAFLQERNRLINAVIFYQIGTLLKLSPLLLANLIAATVYDIGNIIPRLKAWFWIISHFPRLMKKRKAIQKQRKVSDREIVRYMSCKFYEEELLDNKFLKKIIKFFNKIQCGYCYITGIRTIEFFPISFD